MAMSKFATLKERISSKGTPFERLKNIKKADLHRFAGDIWLLGGLERTHRSHLKTPPFRDALIVDYGSFSKDILIECCSQFENLSVLSICVSENDDDAFSTELFVINYTALRGRLATLCSTDKQDSSSWPLFIDISGESPVIMSEVELEIIVASIREAISRLLRSLTEASSCDHQIPVNLSSIQNLFLPSLIGVLLNYPIVYAAPFLSENSLSNSLSFSTLRQFTVFVNTEDESSQSTNNDKLFAYSFTLPDALVSDMRVQSHLTKFEQLHPRFTLADEVVQTGNIIM